MKNNKAMTYVLLALVVGIWGYVIYRVIAQVGDDNQPSVQIRPKSVIDNNLSYYRWKDSLSYDTIYLSPFASIEPLPELVEEEYAPETDFYAMEEMYDPLAYAPAMDIEYLGYIASERHKQRIALVQINGKQYYMHPKQQIDGVTLMKVDPNDIEIKTDYQTLTIHKK